MKHSAQILVDASKLSGGNATECWPVSNRGNSSIFKVLIDAEPFALKYYRRNSSDSRDRWSTEAAALGLLSELRPKLAPSWIDGDQKSSCALLEWIDGVSIERPTAGDLEYVNKFTQHLVELGDHPASQPIGLASEACLCMPETARQIHNRLDRLAASSPERDLQEFLEQELRPALERITAASYEGYSKVDADISANLPRDEQTLSPSDFGFHNSLRQRDGNLIFLDFEYFGWDDPVKMIADFLLHPANFLSERHKINFAKNAEQIFGMRRHYQERLRYSLPLFALRWCMILLNVYLPISNSASMEENFAERTPGGQLLKAQKMLKIAENLSEELARAS